MFLKKEEREDGWDISKGTRKQSTQSIGKEGNYVNKVLCKPTQSFKKLLYGIPW